MFCHKCGTKSLDNADFCQKCGAKLVNDQFSQQTSTDFVTNVTSLNSELKTHKKKSKKLPIIITTIAIIVIAIIIGFNFEGKPNYVATVGSFKPFKAQGTDLSFVTVLNKYLESPKWEVRKLEDAVYVDIIGTPKSVNKKIVVTIKVTDDKYDPSIAVIAPESVTIGDEKLPTKNDAIDLLLLMFFAYEDGINDMYEILSEKAIHDNKSALEEEPIQDHVPSENTIISNDNENHFNDILAEYIGFLNDDTYIGCEYAFYDIDLNGEDELLVRYRDNLDEYIKLYTYVDGKTNEIGEYWSRNRLLLDVKGNLYIISSGGAAYTTLELANISTDCTSLTVAESWEMNDDICTHISSTEVKAISEEEFLTVFNRFDSIGTDFIDSLNWQPLAM